jgi:hypothetical protein
MAAAWEHPLKILPELARIGHGIGRADCRNTGRILKTAVPDYGLGTVRSKQSFAARPSAFSGRQANPEIPRTTFPNSLQRMIAHVAE